MQNSTLKYSEEQMQFIQKITKASRQEVIHTIRISRISVEELIDSLKKSILRRLRFAK